MDSPLLRRVLALALGLLGVLLLLLLLWPTKKRERPSPKTEPVPVVAAADADPAHAERGKATLVHGPSIDELPEPTEKCVMLVEWHQRNVPAWVIEDNMDAQAMKFDEKDLACMTAGGLPPQILDRAEQNVLRPQPTSPR
ncbi:MAG: hypothetical protein H6738_21120 [Alphaproteobacteria bacterium]|nr:hypothetical protein [Alphaproteobacteria bacterium]MCB9699296.1 hypothetical protein [Alphaproteobacteria bacterium]